MIEVLSFIVIAVLFGAPFFLGFAYVEYSSDKKFRHPSDKISFWKFLKNESVVGIFFFERNSSYRKFISGRTQEQREHFVEKMVRMSEDKPFYLTGHQINSMMDCTYHYPNTFMQITVNFALSNLRDILPRYNRQLEYIVEKNVFVIKKIK